MEIKLKHFKIKDIVEGYSDNSEEGCFAYGGKLNIRPKYQREYVYEDEQRNEVIRTIQQGFPLNIMYWVKNGDTYEVLDGQQRTISFCQFIKEPFAINDRTWNNLQKDEQEKILNYKLDIYICEGTDSEKLKWFKTVNISGEPLSNQELRNAVYTGSWLTDAKRYFCRNQCAAFQIANQYMKGKPIRQDYLETVLKWIGNGKIETYMSTHQNDKNADDIWLYFQKVISWVKAKFTIYRKEMKGLPWGILYDTYSHIDLDSKIIENEIKKLMEDDEITSKKGIYEYILSEKKNEKILNIRSFNDKQKRESYEKQNGICVKCNIFYDYSNMQGDHIIPWSKNGKTISDNCQMLCAFCNGTKSDN